MLGGEQNSSVVEIHKNTKMGKGVLNKWPNTNEKTAIRKLPTGDKSTELRNLCTLAYKKKIK
jgi:hypothetical protein